MATRSVWSALLIALAFLANASFAADAAAGGDIVVVGAKGDVRVTMRGQPRAVKQGTVMQLAATVRTGADGSMQLRQGNTSVAVASDSILELPAGQALGDPIDRLVQPKGNVYYDVGKRGARKLRVETPYLVAVIKGTQFNVAVHGQSTTVSLFEGSLEIRATDGSDVVDLEAGEIAIRHAGDRSIRVLRMDTGEPVARVENRNAPVGFLPADGGNSMPHIPDAVDTDLARVAPGAGVNGTPNLSVNLSVNDGLNVSVPTSFDIDNGLTELATEIGLQAGDKNVAAVGLEVGLGLDAGVDLAAGAIDVGVDAGVDLGGASVDAGVDVGVDLGGGTVDLGVDAGVDLGGASVDVGLDAGVDLGGGTIDVGVDAGVDLGGAAVDVGVDAGVDLGGGAVDLGIDAGVDLGGAALVDVGADAGVDLGAGAIDLGVDAGIVGVDAGVDAGVDLSAGTVGVDMSVGGLDLGLGIDLGAGTVDLGVGTVTPTVPGGTPGGTTPPASGGGLLGGIVGGIGGLLGGGR